jgi:hypothetical protein
MPEELDYDDYSEDVDLDPANRPPSNRVERFKGEANKTYRTALLYFHPVAVTLYRRMGGAKADKAAFEETLAKALAKRAELYGKKVEDLQEWEKLDLANAQFKKYATHFHDDVGMVVSRLGKDGPEADKVWRSLPEPRTYYSTIALFYPTDAAGNVDAKNIVRDGFCKLWRFSNATFRTLIAKNDMLKEYKQSLANSDLRLQCKNSQFQTFDIDPAGAAIWLKTEAIRNHFLPLAYALYDKLVDAKSMSTAELREKLKMSAGDSGGDVSSESELDDLLGTV